MAAPKTAYVQEAGTAHISLEMPKHPPRLAVALFWAKSGQYDCWQTDLEKEVVKDPSKVVDLDAATTPESFDRELGRLLKHIQQRLEIGLSEAWISRYGYNAPQPPRADGKTPEQFAQELTAAWEKAWALNGLYQEPEEEWARQFAEMFVFAPYAGMGQAAFDSGEENYRILQAWPKVYSTLVACQHLSSYTPLTRGFGADKLKNGMNASANAGLPIFDPVVQDGNARPSWITTEVSTYERRDLRPGDLVAGKDADPNQKGFAHAASVLRRWPLGAAAKAESAANLQLIDTGVLASIGDSNTQDHGWLTTAAITSAFSKAVAAQSGFGRLAEASSLKDAVSTSRKALPMGFTRLVLAAPGGRARYVSAMLPMWHGEHRFSLARYLWSLRDLPAKNLVAYWAVYAALGHKLFDELVKEADAPGRSCEALMTAAKAAHEAAEAARQEAIKEAVRTGKPAGDAANKVGKRPSLLRSAAITSKPRVVRFVSKTSTVWKEVVPNEPGRQMTYEEGPEADALRAKWKRDAAAKKARYGSSPSEVRDVSGQNSGMPLDLAARPGKDKGDLGRPGGWDFLASERFYSTELLIVDPMKPGDVVERPMAQNEVDYFKGGTAGAAPAGGAPGGGSNEPAASADAPEAGGDPAV